MQGLVEQVLTGDGRFQPTTTTAKTVYEGVGRAPMLTRADVHPSKFVQDVREDFTSFLKFGQENRV